MATGSATKAAPERANGILVQQFVGAERINDLLTSAFEGGSNYWALTVSITDGPAGVNELYASDVPMAGGVVTVVDGENGNKPYTLDRAACERGATIMAAKYPTHWGAFMGGDDDATTGDVFLQCCLFGELVYG